MTNHGVSVGKLPKWFLVCADLLLVFILGVIDYLGPAHETEKIVR